MLQSGIASSLLYNTYCTVCIVRLFCIGFTGPIAELDMRHIFTTRQAPPRHIVLPTRHASPRFLFNFFSLAFTVSRHLSYFLKKGQKIVLPCHKLNPVSTPTRTNSRLPNLLAVNLHPSSWRTISPILAVKPPPLLLAVNLHPSSWRSTSTPPPGGQPPSLLLANNLPHPDGQAHSKQVTPSCQM